MLSLHSTLMSPPVLVAEKWYFADDELCLVSSRHAWCLERRFIRPENLVSHSLRVLFLQIPSGFSCVFTEERLESGHSAIKPRSVECCSDVCPSVSFSHLHTWSWNDHHLLGHHSNQGPSPSIAQFGQEANSRKSPGYSSPDLCLDTILSLSSGFFF